MSLKQKIERKRFDILMSLAAKVDVVSEFPEELWAEIDKHVFEGEPLGRLLRRNNDVTTRYERSYALSLAFDKCNLVRGTLPRYGKVLDDDHDLDFINGWVEDDQYVYDPTFMKRFDKNFYYYLFDAKVLRQITSEELDNDKKYHKLKREKSFDIKEALGIKDPSPKKEKNETIIPNDVSKDIDDDKDEI